MSLLVESQKVLLDRFGDRWISAKSLKSFKDVFVENTAEFALSGRYVDGDKEYACYIDYFGHICGCLDEQIRKGICKHLIGLCLFALKKKMISPLELLCLLLGG